MSFNNFEPHWGDSEGLILFLSWRLPLRSIFQCLHTKTIRKRVFDKLQRTMLKPVMEAEVSAIFFTYIT